MKHINSFLCLSIIAVTLTFSACSPKIQTVASWINKDKIQPEPYKSVFIIVLSGNLNAKVALENDLAAAAEARGLKAFKSINVIGPFSGKESIPSKEVIQKKIKEIGCETVLTVALIDKQSVTRYVPGSTTVYAPYAMYPYYGSFGSYYGYASVIYYDPGYYQTDKTYFMESNLYDTKTDLLIMSIQSKAVNPTTIEESSKQYTATLVDEVEKLRPAKK
jgi:hypothetical protein